MTYLRFVFSNRRAGSNTRVDNTEADVGVEFNSTAQVPQPSEVAQTLVDAVSNPNNTFNISIVRSSVKIVGECTHAPTSG